ncbi:MAG: hypothetical protein OP8BY_0658 [Candidatus Saccharicenans subterraneus]|uniref:Uncharacterized protein n=1 Tax=Candidatus Saccharicenans subterraneus TaxID=2508984 RepID=A0A3E2BKH8_9BACT|nr:MAG: hypothetical protein OP8BY_0658 [Candidatus Saccharicenans subterraneum]
MKRFLTCLFVVLLVLTFSCKKAEEAKSAKPEKTVSKTERPAEEAKSAPEPAEKAEKTAEKVTALDFKVLEQLLPEKSGWTKSNVRGQQFSYGEGQTSMAEADYSSGESRVHVIIMDTARIAWTMGQFQQMVQMGFSAKDDRHYVKTTKINNQPAIEEYDYQDKDGQLQVLIKDRFLITIRGNNIENNNILYDFFNAIDLKKFD